MIEQAVLAEYEKVVAVNDPVSQRDKRISATVATEPFWPDLTLSVDQFNPTQNFFVSLDKTSALSVRKSHFSLPLSADK
jgi:hypothetical protein